MMSGDTEVGGAPLALVAHLATLALLAPLALLAHLAPLAPPVVPVWHQLLQHEGPFNGCPHSAQTGAEWGHVLARPFLIVLSPHFL